MRKLLLVLTIGLFVSCDIGDDNDSLNFTSEFVVIESVDIPSEFVFGENYEISLNYTRPSNCYEFQRIIIDPTTQSSRTIGVVDTRFFDDSCEQIPNSTSVSFNFFVPNLEIQVFQFYQGIVDGQDQYLVVEVPVVE